MYHLQNVVHEQYLIVLFIEYFYSYLQMLTSMSAFACPRIFMFCRYKHMEPLKHSSALATDKILITGREGV